MASYEIGRIIGKCTVQIFRDEVLIYQGEMYGSKQIPHTPPPGPHNYRIRFLPTGQYGGYTSQRTALLQVVTRTGNF